MMTYLTTALVLAIVGLGLSGLVFLIMVPAKWFLDRHATRNNVKQWTDDFIPECADVLAQEASLPDVTVKITADTTALQQAMSKSGIDVAALKNALALKAAEADALAALDEVAALLADPDVAEKLAVLAEGWAA